MKEKKVKDSLSGRQRDSLVESLVTSLNKTGKRGDPPKAYYLDGSMDSPTNVDTWISTGSSMLDLAISNRKHGGVPVGRIVSLEGLEGSGKSLLAAIMIAETQRQGGIGVYIDTENAVFAPFIEMLGVDVSNMIHCPAETIESGFEYLEHFITEARKADPNRLVTIVFDSVAGGTTLTEQAGDHSKTGFNTEKAIVMSKSLRKITNMIGQQKCLLIFTNQLRERPGVMFGDPYTTPGGRALPFHSSVILRLEKKKALVTVVNGVKEEIGVNVKVKVKKNRMGPPGRSVVFELFYDRGIDDYAAWFDLLDTHNLLERSGNWYTYNFLDMETGEVVEEIKFQRKQFSDKLRETPGLREQIYDRICDATIMQYDTRDLDPDDIEKVDEVG